MGDGAPPPLHGEAAEAGIYWGSSQTSQNQIYVTEEMGFNLFDDEQCLAEGDEQY